MKDTLFWIKKAIDDLFVLNRRLWLHLILGAILGKLLPLTNMGYGYVVWIALIVAVVIECVQMIIAEVDLMDTYGDIIGMTALAAWVAW